MWSYLEAPTDTLNPLRTVTILLSQKRSGYKFITAVCDGNSPTDKSLLRVTLRMHDGGYVKTVAVGQRRRLC